jgi:hypothetical protein
VEFAAARLWNKIQRSLVSCVEGQIRTINRTGDRTVFIHAKIALSAFLILFAASAAMANDLETSPAGTQSARKWSDYPDHTQTRGKAVASNSYDGPDWERVSGSAIWRQSDAGKEQNANSSTCPWLEGYPDCHPDAVHQPDIQPPRRHPITDPSRHQRRL